MIQRTDIFQFVWVYGGIWWGLEDEQVYQDLKGEGIGSGEKRYGELWNEQNYESLPALHKELWLTANFHFFL